MKNVIWLIIAIFLTGCLQVEKYNGGNDIFWDLSKKKDLHYSLSSITNIEKKSIYKYSIKDSDFMESIQKSSRSFKGSITVCIKDNELADIVSKSIFESYHIGYDNDTVRHRSFRDTNLLIKNMKKNGLSSDQNSKTNSYFFPNECYKLEIGDTFKQSMHIKKELNGLEISADGYNSIIFEAIRTIDNKTCAVFRGTIDVSNLKLDKGLTDKNKCYKYGIVFYYFDLENHNFLGCTFNTVTEFHINQEVNKVELLEMSDVFIEKTTKKIWIVD